LIPCCGFDLLPPDALDLSSDEREIGVLIMGCDIGINPEIEHSDKHVSISHSGLSRIVSQSDWATAIVGFTDQVLGFYDSCSLKTEIEDEYSNAGWQQFWDELRMRRDEALEICKRVVE